MANGHGGARTPSNPAPVSGPGRLSRRTDGQPVRSPGGMAYGENADFQDLQSSAPMAQAASPNPNTRLGSAASPGAPTPIPLSAPSQRPNEPVTEGNPMGPGAGPGVLSVPTEFGKATSQDMQMIKQYLPDLEVALNFPNTPSSFRWLVNYLRSQ